MFKYVFYFIIIALSFTCCLKDNGNYDYTKLEDVVIGLDNEYRFFLQEPYQIVPTIDTEIAESNLEYNWMIGNDTLSRTKELNYTFTQLFPAEKMIFEVRDVRNDVRYVKRMTINIVSPFQTGWVLLSERGGESQLSLLSYERDNILYLDVYNQVNGESLGGKPRFVKQMNFYDSFSGTYLDRISILNENGKNVEIDGSNFLKVKNYEDEYRGSGSFNPISINSEFYGDDYYLFLVSDGKIYSKNLTSSETPDDAWYEFPLDEDELGYYVNNNYTKSVRSEYYLMVDELNNRYVSFQHSSFTTTVTSLRLEDGSLATVDVNNLEGESVWMGRASDSRALSLLRTPGGDYVLHILTNTIYNDWTVNAKYILPQGVVKENSVFERHATSPYLMIGTDNDLYALNLEALDSGASAVNHIRSFDGEITCMHYAYHWSGINDFGVAIKTADSDLSGTLIIIDPILSSLGNVIYQYDNVGGVIGSMCRKR